jgi:hypothetical protein
MPWQVAQQGINSMGNYWGSMAQAGAIEDQASAQRSASQNAMWAAIGTGGISAFGNVQGAQIEADAMRAAYGY